jgi:glycosyltransferase involved in cell wall biosynthesis
MSGRFILQREVPHYRVPLFRRLYERYGVKIIAASQPPSATGLKLGADLLGEAFVPFPMHFPSPEDPFRAEYSVHGLIEELKPDVIISEVSLRSPAQWALPLARRRGRLGRLAYWTHGWNMERSFRRPVDLVAQCARLPSFAAADAIGTYSDEGARWVRRCLPWQTVITLGNALDREGMRRAATAAPVRHGAPQLLSIGRIRADKNVDRILDVFFHLQRMMPDAGLTIIGDGPGRERLERRAGAELNRAIRFMGALYDEAELAPHFLGADVYVLGGAAGLSVNHALAYALPIVAFPRSPRGPFHHPEIEYVVPDRSGILVEDYDDEAMAATIAESYRSGRLARLRTALETDPVAPSIEDVADNFGRLLNVLEAR